MSITQMSELKESDKAIIRQIATEVSTAHQANCPFTNLISQKLDGVIERLNQLDETLKEQHNKIWVGNGSPSFVVRLDRLENQQSRRTTWIAIAFATLSLFVAGLAVEVVKSNYLPDKPDKATTAAATPKVTP